MARRKTRSNARHPVADPDDLDAEHAFVIQNWDQLSGPFSTFVVTEKEGNEINFVKGNIATILPHGVDPSAKLDLNEYWICRIKEIKAVVYSEDSNNVWAKVQWYYKPKDVSEMVKSFKPGACSSNELLYSDHIDIVNHASFNEVINVAKFDERKLEQEYIGPEQLFRRYNFEVDVHTVIPKPGLNTCICSKPYSTSDPDTLVHMCPRPSCLKSFHEACLLSKKGKEGSPYVDKTDKITRDLNILSVSPDHDEPIDLERLLSERPRKKRRRTSRSAAASLDEGEDDEDVVKDLPSALATIPTLLLQVAQHPIIRGGRFGVVGNVAPVVRARRIVYSALSQNGQVPEDWEEEILGRGSGKWPGIAKVFGKDIEQEKEVEQGKEDTDADTQPANGETGNKGKGGKKKVGKVAKGEVARRGRFAIPALLCPTCGTAI